MSPRPTEDLGPADVAVGQEWLRFQCQRVERRRCRVKKVDAAGGRVLMERIDGVDDVRWESMGTLLSRWKLVSEAIATVAP